MRTIVFAVLALASCAATPETSSQSIAAKARALDGDTLAVDIRLLGVDAFERRQLCEREGGCWPCGKAAQDFSADALRADTASIRLTSSTSYGRPVAVVTVDGQDLGERLIRAGLAIPQPQYLRDDPARAGRYNAAFARAVKIGAGALAGRWMAPQSWRRGERLRCEQ